MTTFRADTAANLLFVPTLVILCVIVLLLTSFPFLHINARRYVPVNPYSEEPPHPVEFWWLLPIVLLIVFCSNARDETQEVRGYSLRASNVSFADVRALRGTSAACSGPPLESHGTGASRRVGTS